eukprot:TRINITY_DN122603_c0_g1_i1.p1 TRINITY_DN122603_c0_g1~~TRINITY_DN122603_c0_g1_i1.p1  ORF type:complete len:389 (-),score=67.19 TRINITY_DN122603_c0_g1_i1:241-1407(-)
MSYKNPEPARPPPPAAAPRRPDPNYRPGAEFMRWCDGQQRVRLLIPPYPVHSRIADVDRVWEQELQHETRRLATLQKMDLCDRERKQRLQKTWSLVNLNRTDSLAKPATAQRRHASSMPPGLLGAYGRASGLASVDTLPAAATAPLPDIQEARLLSRRTDVHLMRSRRAKEVEEQRKQHAKLKARDLAYRDEMMDDIDAFEAARPWNVETKDPAVAGKTAYDWTHTRPTRQPCDARPSPKLRIQFDETAASGWLTATGEEVAPSPFHTQTSGDAWARASARQSNGSFGSALRKTGSSFLEEHSPRHARPVTFADDIIPPQPQRAGPSGLSLRKLQPSILPEDEQPEFNNTVWKATIKGGVPQGHSESDIEGGSSRMQTEPDTTPGSDT